MEDGQTIADNATQSWQTEDITGALLPLPWIFGNVMVLLLGFFSPFDPPLDLLHYLIGNPSIIIITLSSGLCASIIDQSQLIGQVSPAWSAHHSNGGHTLGEIDIIVPCEELIVDLGQMDRRSHKKWRLFMLFF